MDFIFYLICLNFLNVVYCYNLTKENSYHGLPPIFHIDDYEECKIESKLFCKISVILKPYSQNFSHHWKLIQRSMEEKRDYNHNELFHAICLQSFCPNITINEKTNLKSAITECYMKKYNNFGLSADIVYLKCGNFDDIHKAGIIDLTWMIIFIMYIIYILWATYWDYKCDKKYILYRKTFIEPFSLIGNFEKFKKISTNPDFHKLKCIQGIRFYNMLLIIFCHTYSSYIGGYIMNTEYIENIPQNPIKLGLRNLMVFLVQSFFLFSSFLMSYHFFQITKNDNNCNPKIIWLTFINRYFRVVPPVIIMILMGTTIWVVNLFYGPIKDLYSDLEYNRCLKNWWTSLLFINNHYNQHDMCYFTTWYLAADTQLYVMSLIILAMIWKYKKNVKYFLLSFISLGIFIPVIISYTYNLDIIYRLIPENSKNNKFRSFKFNAIYSSTYANMATYMVGLYFGYLYFKLRKSQIIINKYVAISRVWNFETSILLNIRTPMTLFEEVTKLTWFISFLGLPTLVVIVSSYYYSRFISAILCGILKPLYALGIAVGIFGMSKNIGGIIKEICEWKPALILGNLTYSTYMVHYVIVFYRTATAKQPYYLSDFVMIQSFIIDAVISFFCGFLMHIFIEIPAMNIQNLCISQVRSRRCSIDEEKAK